MTTARVWQVAYSAASPTLHRRGIAAVGQLEQGIDVVGIQFYRRRNVPCLFAFLGIAKPTNLILIGGADVFIVAHALFIGRFFDSSGSLR